MITPVVGVIAEQVFHYKTAQPSHLLTAEERHVNARALADALTVRQPIRPSPLHGWFSTFTPPTCPALAAETPPSPLLPPVDCVNTLGSVLRMLLHAAHVLRARSGVCVSADKQA